MHRNKQSRSEKGKTRRRATVAAPVGDRSQKPASETKISRRRILLIIGVVVVVILVILAIPCYNNYIAPFNQTIITVDGNEVSARDFLERARIADSDPMTVLEALTEEMVIEIMAPQYGIEVTDDDVEQQLRVMASDESGDISDVEFEEWYRQQLNDNQVSDSQYRELIYISMLTSQLYSYLVEQTPTVADQVHLHVIMVTDYDVAEAAVARLEAGDDFAAVAREVSVDSNVEEDGGDVGWLPPVLIADYGSLIADLDIGEVLGPLVYYSSSSTSTSEPSAYFIFMVSEKESNHELSEDNRAALQSIALDLWLDEEIPKHEVSYNFDSDIYNWMCDQLAES